MVDRRPEDMVRITTPELAQAFIDEQVIEVFRNQMDANLIYVDAVDWFLDKLAGVDDPEDMNFELVEPVRISSPRELRTVKERSSGAASSVQSIRRTL